jgi:CheY-like chemotaxis protein
MPMRDWRGHSGGFLSILSINPVSQLLVIEDDPVVTETLQRLCDSEQVTAAFCKEFSQAKTILEKSKIKLIVADVLIPGESGVDIAKKIKSEEAFKNIPLVLTSGVFTDEAFIKESTRETGANHFVRKPIDLEAFKALLDKYIPRIKVHYKVDPKVKLYQLAANSELTGRAQLKVLESLEWVDGYDLPFIYSVLMNAKISGHLNMSNKKADVFGVSFSKGYIVNVDMVDEKTFLGALLIEAGFILPEDLDSGLNFTSSQRLGEKLISMNLLSPHGFEQVLSHQMSIRLSKIINEEQLKINFVPGDVPLTRPHIDRALYLRFLNDWVAAKIPMDWIEAFFSSRGHFVLKNRAGAELARDMKKFALTQSLSKELSESSNLPVEEQLSRLPSSQRDLYRKALFFLLCGGWVNLQEGEGSSAILQKRLLQWKAKLEVTDLTAAFHFLLKLTQVSTPQPEVVFQNFLKILGPPPPKESQALHQLYQEVQKLAQFVVENFEISVKRVSQEDIEKRKLEQRLEFNKKFEAAKTALIQGRYKESIQALREVAKSPFNFERVQLYLIWAELLDWETQKKTADQVRSEFEQMVFQVPPEDKFDVLFIYLQGLQARICGDYSLAKKMLEKAIAMDSNFFPARRDMTIVQVRLKEASKGLLETDLKTIVSSLFSRKKA